VNVVEINNLPLRPALAQEPRRQYTLLARIPKLFSCRVHKFYDVFARRRDKTDQNRSERFQIQGRKEPVVNKVQKGGPGAKLLKRQKCTLAKFSRPEIPHFGEIACRLTEHYTTFYHIRPDYGSYFCLIP